jgi:Nucleoside diphosphate kinase
MHSARPFFKDLCTFISSGPLVAIVLEGKDAIAKNRELMGATNPAEAKEGTIRKLYAISIDKNSVHGSDSLESAKREIELFFNKD